MNKAEIRLKYKNIRKNISLSDSIVKSKQITENLIKSGLLDNCKCVFTYISYGREVNTESLIDYLFSENKTVLIPKCDTTNETMIPVIYHKSDKMTDNIYGIKENSSADEYKNKIDIAIVPGISFDKFGNRVGHGKGYYDKFFDNRNLLKIGLCYDACISAETIPCSSNDIAMDYVISDREVLKIKS